MATVDQPVPPGDSPAHDGDTLQNPRRRDYMSIGAVSFAGVGVAVIALPLINSMSPAADTLALSTTELDVSGIEPGQSVKSTFRKQPLFVRHLTPQEIAAADAVSMADLRDPQSLADRTKAGKSQWLITLGVCTHLGCVPLGAGEGENKGRSAAISARAMRRPTTRRGAFVRVRHPPIWKCHPMNSRRIRRSWSVRSKAP